jgi:N-acyl-L-homoserine lactone synthetase
MRHFRCVTARTKDEIADAQRLRWSVFGEEEGLLAESCCFEGREIDARDDDSRTIHLVVYDGHQPVGTMRLLAAIDEDMRDKTGLVGLDLESRFDLCTLISPGIVPAEVTRFCVLRRYRRSGAAGALFSGLCEESTRRGITHWVAAANMETDVAEDADLAYRTLRRQNLGSERFRIEPRSSSSLTTPRRHPYYSEEQRRLAEGNGRGIEPPRTLTFFARSLGARYAGPPVYDTHFGVFALPLVATVPMRRASRADRLSAFQ